ncbi:MAG TPA: prolyl aminopeptidase [Erysipelothrix sp.]
MKVDHYLKVDANHEIAIYTQGNPQNPAILFLHGGPGGHITPASFDFFDLDKWFVIAFDQRGCGQSKPFASLKDNTIMDAFNDIEKIRAYFGIERWTLFGGSYGSTLALYYAIHAADKVEHLVLRGIFLGRDEDIKWLYQEGASYFYPYEHARFKAMIAPEKQNDLIQGYYEIFLSNDQERKRTAAKVWADWESSLVHLIPKKLEQEISDSDISIALLECHYFAHKMFWDDDNYILAHHEKFKAIPMDIVHGRYDVDCRLSAAYQLVQAVEHGQLHIVEASGHSPFEPEMKKKLRAITDGLVLKRSV